MISATHPSTVLEMQKIVPTDALLTSTWQWERAVVDVAGGVMLGKTPTAKTSHHVPVCGVDGWRMRWLANNIVVVLVEVGVGACVFHGPLAAVVASSQSCL